MSPQVASDPRAEASFPHLAWASLRARTLNQVQRMLLGGGAASLRATDPRRNPPASETLEALRNQPPPFRSASLLEPDDTRRLIVETCPHEVEHALARARAVRNGTVELLGAQWTGWPPGWHSDPRSPVQWSAATPGRRVLDRYPEPGADPKIPWELGRFQFALPLVQSWWLTHETQWAEAYLEWVDSWIEANPFPLGVHWASAMEVALRAFSWTHAIWHLRDAACFDESFWQRWRASLCDHARYIRLCLEWEPLGNGNHYLANVLGLAALAEGIPGLLSTAVADRTHRRVEREAGQQTLSDGANFEGSTAYHQFVTEMFVWASASTNRFGPQYHRQVASQLVYLDALCRADGSIPHVGDDDSGRILPLSGARAQAILDSGFALIEGAPRRHHGEEPTADLLWAGGRETLARWRGSSVAPASPGWKSFHQAGTHILEESGWQVTAVAGPKRGRAGGGHFHSDLLSVVAHVNAHEILLDPGTLGYAGTREERDELRRAGAHSTLAPTGVEPRRLIAGFSTAPAPLVGTARRGEWLDLEVELAAGFFVRRSVRLSAGSELEIVDEVQGQPGQTFDLNFVLGAGEIESSKASPEVARVQQQTPAGALELQFIAEQPIEIDVLPLVAASGYGQPLAAHRIRIRCTPNAPVQVRSTLVLRGPATGCPP